VATRTVEAEKNMKKLMGMMLAACMVAGFSLAQVTSLNVVGYCTVSLTNGYNMLAVNLGPVGNPNGTIDINTLLPTGQVAVVAAGLTGKTTPSGADGVRVWNVTSGAFSNYFLFKHVLTSNTKNYKWCYDDGSAYPVATCTFSTGDGFWFNLVGTNKTTIQIAGQVPNDVSKTKTLVQGYNMIGAGFSADWSLNAIGTNYWSNSAFTGKTTPSGADGVRIWYTSSQTFSNYFLFKHVLTSNTKNYKWCYDNGSTYPVMTDVIPMQSAVWFVKAAAGTCSFVPQIPYSLSN